MHRDLHDTESRLTSSPGVTPAIAIRSSSPGAFKLTIEHLWIGLPLFVVLWKSFVFPLPLLDFWWHLKMGEVIATTASIPRTDLFSFTNFGNLFVLQNWLAELLYYGTYRLGGFPLLVLSNSLLLVAGFIPIYALCVRAAGSVRMGALVAFAAAIGGYVNMRPQNFSFVLFSYYYWILVCYRTRRRDWVWMLPLLMIIWVNLHGAFVLGIALVGLYLASESVRRIIDPARTDALTTGELRKLLFVFVLCIAATFMSPELFKVYDYVQGVMAYQQFVAEWQPPKIDDALGILAFYGPLFAGILVFTYARVKPNLTDIAVFLAFAVLGLKSLRNAAWFGIVAYPLIAQHLPTISSRSLMSLRRFPWVDRIAVLLHFSNRDAQPHFRMNVLVASLALLVLAAQSPWIRPSLYKTSLFDVNTPVAAMDFIDSHDLNGNIYHPQIYGDYLIWRLWPKQKSFFDGRVHIFDLEFVRDYLRLPQDSHWEQLLARWNIRYLLLSKNPNDEENVKMAHAAQASGHWTKLYEDGISVIFEKNSRPE